MSNLANARIAQRLAEAIEGPQQEHGRLTDQARMRLDALARDIVETVATGSECPDLGSRAVAALENTEEGRTLLPQAAILRIYRTADAITADLRELAAHPSAHRTKFIGETTAPGPVWGVLTQTFVDGEFDRVDEFGTSSEADTEVEACIKANRPYRRAYRVIPDWTTDDDDD